MRLARQRGLRGAAVCVLGVMVSVGLAEPLPVKLQGTWRITRLLPTTNVGCWTRDQAMTLVGSELVYSARSMTWKGGPVPLLGVSTRLVDTDDVKAESGGGSGSSQPADFAQLQITASSVLEVNLQHEDADITGATTEVPGDSVLLASPNRIVGSACGVYFEAMRGAAKKAAKAPAKS